MDERKRATRRINCRVSCAYAGARSRFSDPTCWMFITHRKRWHFVPRQAVGSGLSPAVNPCAFIRPGPRMRDTGYSAFRRSAGFLACNSVQWRRNEENRRVRRDPIGARVSRACFSTGECDHGIDQREGLGFLRRCPAWRDGDHRESQHAGHAHRRHEPGRRLSLPRRAAGRLPHDLRADRLWHRRARRDPGGARVHGDGQYRNARRQPAGNRHRVGRIARR